ncbi:MAG TPA: hypothetical protein DCZ03_05680 [Gammaproteobacteria bacterium]|nr:hypothetical protein [Gammaproteobacteria bacterium]
MSGTLLLCHRIPYPPNKGDKIRSYHILKMLQELGPIYLGAFVDEEQDRQYESYLQSLVAKGFFPFLNKRASLMRAGWGFLRGKALSVPYYYRSDMQGWIDDILATHQPDNILVYSSVMAQYVINAHAKIKIVDFVDVDSDKWQQYGQRQRGIKSWIYQREAEKLAQYEGKIAKQFDASFFVAQEEANLFRQRHVDITRQVYHFDNGVDIDYFDPSLQYQDPIEKEMTLVFTGAMDYWPNVDAVVWFATTIFPLIRNRLPSAQFIIVGGNPSDEVLALETIDGIQVTGRVSDVRPYLKFSGLSVAPLRVARGVQNKVLEALAMNVPVVATPAAAVGLRQPFSKAMSICDSPEQFADQCVERLQNKNPATGRDYVTSNYLWSHNLEPLKKALVNA